jgi:hypothetical protein
LSWHGSRENRWAYSKPVETTGLLSQHPQPCSWLCQLVSGYFVFFFVFLFNTYLLFIILSIYLFIYLGDTKVLAAVYGPKAGTKKNENPEKACIEIIWKPKTGQIGHFSILFFLYLFSIATLKDFSVYSYLGCSSNLTIIVSKCAIYGYFLNIYKFDEF